MNAPRLDHTSLRTLVLALALALPAAAAFPAAAQSQQREAPINWVDGRPMVLVQLKAGDVVYPCHVLLDLSTRRPLFLHSNAAGSLKAQEVTVQAGSITLSDLPVEARRDRWLEGLTARHAQALNEVPVAGILGTGAFGDSTLELDGPGKTLRVLPPGNSAAADAAGAVTVDFAADPRRSPPQVNLTLENGRSARFVLHTREPYSFVDPQLAKAAGHPDGVLRRAWTTGLDFAAIAPFRPMRSENGDLGGIGGAVLQQMVTTLELQPGRMIFRRTHERPYPEDEAAFYAAAYGDDPVPALRKLLREHPASAFAHEAAHLLLDQALARTPHDVAVARDAALAALAAAAKDQKGKEATDLVAKLPAYASFAALHEELVRTALPLARDDVDGQKQHELRLELGRIAHARGDLDEARRQLLSAVFGIPHHGPAHLALGKVEEARGELERARARYFLALLDMQNTGVEGLVAFEAVHRRMTGSDAGMVQALVELSEGRVPALHPIPREPEAVNPTGRVVLVELFTGAMCPPCAAADVAFDALSELYRGDEVALIQWHLPVPAPEPLVAQASLDRAQRHGVRGTPTLVIAGRERIVGGGQADQAAETFGKYQAALQSFLAEQPKVEITARAWLEKDGDTVQLRAKAKGQGSGLRLHAVLLEELIVFPGRNGILFHHHVARAAFASGEGIALAKAKDGEEVARSLSLRRVAAELDETVSGLESRGPFAIRPTTPKPGALHVVVFVEDGGGTVLQACTIRVTHEGDE